MGVLTNLGAIREPPSRTSAIVRGFMHRVGPLRPHRRRGHSSRVAFYARFLSAGDLCLDIGANVGNRVAAFHALGARVVAVEPQVNCVAVLQRRFGWSDRVVILPVGLADREGMRTLHVASFDQISSMSPEWLDAVQQTGRFGTESWAQRQDIRVITMDRLIAVFGVPRFCKIDVEGFEVQVLRGLSTPVPALSFEFTPECRDMAETCIAHLETLGMYEFNYSIGESMQLALPGWVTADDVVAALASLPGTPPLFGDVYARLQDAVN
jgi:FkbM family methyltransferase